MNRSYGDHKVPEPFQDEDKYAGLTKTQIVFLLPVVIVCGAILIQTFKWGIFLLGIILSVLIAELALFAIFMPVPKEKYLFGSGLKMGTLMVRVLKKKLPKNKVVYTKFYDDVKEW